MLKVGNQSLGTCCSDVQERETKHRGEMAELHDKIQQLEFVNATLSAASVTQQARPVYSPPAPITSSMGGRETSPSDALMPAAHPQTYQLQQRASEEGPSCGGVPAMFGANPVMSVPRAPASVGLTTSFVPSAAAGGLCAAERDAYTDTPQARGADTPSGLAAFQKGVQPGGASAGAAQLGVQLPGLPTVSTAAAVSGQKPQQSASGKKNSSTCVVQ